MYIIQQITNDPKQSQILILPDGSLLTLQIYFSQMQQGWFITNLTYGTFTINGLRITNIPNMLNQFRNQIPFGLACFTTASREPSLQEDFSSGNSILYILDQTEVAQYASILSGG